MTAIGYAYPPSPPDETPQDIWIGERAQELHDEYAQNLTRVSEALEQVMCFDPDFDARWSALAMTLMSESDDADLACMRSIRGLVRAELKRRAEDDAEREAERWTTEGRSL